MVIVLDRGMIKWAPFSSVINGDYLVKEILAEKKKTTKPELSEEQIEAIEKLIVESYINKDELNFIIYQQGYFYKIKGLIVKIEMSKKKIYLNNYQIIYFCEIVKAFK